MTWEGRVYCEQSMRANKARLSKPALKMQDMAWDCHGMQLERLQSLQGFVQIISLNVLLWA